MKRFLLEMMLIAIVAWILERISDVPFISLAALIYSMLQVIHLINSFGKRLPFKELIISIMAIQMLISPYLEYHYFQFEIIGGMNVDEITYYSYAFPCTILIQLGLELFHPKESKILRWFELISLKPRTNEFYGIMLIIGGYAGLFITQTTKIITVDFIIYLLSLGRIIGFLYLWISKSKFTIPAFILVVIPFALEAINSAMFVELIVYSVILMTILFLKLKTSRVVIYLTVFAAFFVLVVVQSVKHQYRVTISKDNFSESKSSLFVNSVFNQIENAGDLDLLKIGGLVNVRLNQGWILADVLKNLGKKKEKIKPKYFYQEVQGIVFPRFIFPDKPIVGSHEKFKDYCGYALSKRVAMTVGVMGDGYGNFGYIGGMIYSFCFGVLIGLLFRFWHRIADVYPTLVLWGVLIFFYSMRAGDETYIIINWIIKTSFLVFIYFVIFERRNSIQSYKIHQYSQV